MEQKLYNGELTITFTPGNHSYKLNGKRLVSVTAVTGLLDKPALKFWSANRAVDHITDVLNAGKEITQAVLEEARVAFQKQSKEAADLGTLVHAFAEEYVNSIIAGESQPTLPTDKKVLNGVLAFLRWKDEHQVQFVSSERIIYSKKHDFVGRCDAEAIVDGKLCLIDFKTSKARKEGGVYSEWRYQTAAYQKAAEEEGTIYGGPRMIARFDKETGVPETYILEDLDADFNAFLGLLAVRKREQEL